MEGVLVSVSTGVMKSLLTKLATLLEKDYKLIKGVKTEITSLREEMSSMNAMLVNMSSMEKLDAQQKEWRDKVRELAYDMEDCVDTFMHDLDHGATKAGFLYRIKALKRKYEIANLIKDLKSRAVEQSNCRDRYKLDERIDRPRHVAIDPRLPALYAEAASLVGIDGPKEELIKLLTREDGTQQLQVVSIVGFGGIGKTTLAKHVYTEIGAQFDYKAFVSVSQNPNLVKVLTTILSGGNPKYYLDHYLDESTRNDERVLIDISRQELKDQRYLIVIDDIWTTEAWNIIKCSFVENNRGSRIIATTRIECVAMACCSCFHDRGHVYKIKPLNDHDSRRLFHRMVFHSEDGCPEQLNNVSDEILKKCGGVPLAILSVASILASHEDVKSKEVWEKMRSNLSFQLETNALDWMRHVFNLSYNDLSLHVKTCMLYLGVFPEDSEILKDDLLRRWIAEGFVCEKYTCGQEEVAESYFNELINRNMIQIAEFNDCGEVMSCRVHDLMLDFIISKSTEDNFMTIISDQHRMKGPLKVRRLSVQAKYLENDEVLSNMALTQARSFSYSGHIQWIPSLPKFRLLRVLHLDVHAWLAEYDLSYICNLFQLRYLRIRGVRYKKLLSQLRKLQHLETLDIARSVDYLRLDVCELPTTLRYLIVPGGLFGEIGRMRALRTLDELETVVTDHRSAETMKGLGELTNLRELKLSRCNGGGEETDDDGFLLSSLCKLGICNLRSLSIRGLFVNDVLTCWSPPPCHLRRLHVLPCRFSMVPDWIAQLDKLSSLEVEVLSLPRDGVQVLARLPFLQHLRLHVKNVPEEGVIIFGAAFRNLKEFWFRCEVMCLTFEVGAMPRLHSLEIDCYAQGVRQANDVLLGIEHLESLKLFRVQIYEMANFMSRWPSLCGISNPHEEELILNPHVKEDSTWRCDSTWIFDSTSSADSLELILSPHVEELILNPDVEELIQNPHVEELIQNPHVEELILNPDVEELIQNPHVEELILNPDVEELIQNPHVEELILNPDMEELILNPDVEELIQNLHVEEIILNPDVEEHILNPDVEELPTWDERSLEAALREAISKHPGSPDISIGPA